MNDSRSDNGGKCSLQNVSCMAENVKIKVAWKVAECQGLHSNGASEDRQCLASPLGARAGHDKLSTFPSC